MARARGPAALAGPGWPYPAGANTAEVLHSTRSESRDADEPSGCRAQIKVI